MHILVWISCGFSLLALVLFPVQGMFWVEIREDVRIEPPLAFAALATAFVSALCYMVSLLPG